MKLKWKSNSIDYWCKIPQYYGIFAADDAFGPEYEWYIDALSDGGYSLTTFDKFYDEIKSIEKAKEIAQREFDKEVAKLKKFVAKLEK